jgi:multidrug resistance efflux pump
MPENDTKPSRLHLEEVNEIINDIPGWINKWGISLVALVFAFLLALSWFIEYPDVIKARVMITTSPPPVTLIARTSGTITVIHHDHEQISKGDFVAYINSNANPNDVLLLESKLMLDSFDPNLDVPLGELQPYLASLLTASNDLEIFTKNDLQAQQVKKLHEQHTYYHKLNRTVASQKSLMKKELQIAHNKFSRDSALFVQQVLSKQDFDNSEALYIQQVRNLNTLESAFLSNAIQISFIEKQIAETQAAGLEFSLKLSNNVKNARRELLARIGKWKETFLFTAPADGTVAFLRFVENGQHIETGDQIFSIIPASGKIYAQSEIPIVGSGKVKPGQAVNIKLDNYPFGQFGMLQGTITNISEVPTEKNYLAKIDLPSTLTTTHKKQLPFKQQLQGETEIITENLRVLERIFYEFRNLISAK